MPKPQRWCACFDLHGDCQDESAVRVFHRFVKYWKPAIKIMGGDLMDLRWLRGRASEGEKRERVEADVNAGLEFLKKYKPTSMLMGNHDHRLIKAMVCDDGPLVDFCTRIHDDLMEVLGDAVVYPYDKRKGVMRLGNLNIVHGYHTGVYAARNLAMTYGSSIMGHVHANDMFSLPSIEPRIGRTVGSLCKLDMGYNEAQPGTLRQGHGFAYGLLLANNTTVTWTAQPVDGVWYFPSEMREVRAS